MPPKAEDVREEPLTAILLADSFAKRMSPITSECPKVLLPLVNAPLVEYMLEWMAMSGVQKVHVLCCSHADQVRAYLNKSTKWPSSDMSLNIISSYNCQSAGEALRLVDQEGLIQDDFILISGDIVTNMDLSRALAQHKARSWTCHGHFCGHVFNRLNAVRSQFTTCYQTKDFGVQLAPWSLRSSSWYPSGQYACRAADKSAIMTLAVSPGVDEAQRILMGMPDLFMTLDPNTNRILSYMDAPDGGTVEVDAAVFSERDAVSVRADLADAGIYICAPEVLVLFSDNFDFQHIQRDFIRGVLSEEELGNKLFVHILQNEYAAHVANMRAYAAISRDVLNRWAYPLCPDSNLLPSAPGPNGDSGQAPDYFMLDGCRYKESSVKDERSAVIGELCCIGAGTHIMDNALVQHSVIGRNCVVHPGALIQDSFIMDSVTVGAGAKVIRSIVCNNATICHDATVSEGCVVSFKCVVGPGHTVPKHARVTLCTMHDGSDFDDASAGHIRSRSGLDDDSGDEDQGLYSPAPATLLAAEQVRTHGVSSATFDVSVVGNGAGFDYFAQHGSQPSDRDMLTSVALPTTELALQRTKLLSMQAESGQSAEEEDGAAAERSMNPEAVFQREVQETLLRTIQLAQTNNTATSKMTENAVIELNGLKIAEVRTFADCARYVLTTLMDLQAMPSAAVASTYHHLFATEQPDVSKDEGKVSLFGKFKQTLDVWASTLQKFLHDDNDQFELLITLEEYCARRGLFDQIPGAGWLYVPIFANVLHQLYEVDIIKEEVFAEWEAQKLQDEDGDQEFLEHARQFLDFLADGSEEDSDDDEDSESEDSDEDD